MKEIKTEKLAIYICTMYRRQTMYRNFSKAWSMSDPNECCKIK